MRIVRRRRPGGPASTLVVFLAAAVLVATVAAGVSGDGPAWQHRTRVAASQRLPGAGGELIAAVGDIACAPTNTNYRAGEGTLAGCREKAVSELLAGQQVAAFLALGDLQYEDGRLSYFTQVYDQFFGRYRSITRPVPGNHEYKTKNARGYYDYFGAAAHEVNPFGAAAAGSYSYNVGSWHIVAINSNLCTPSRPCDDSHPLMRWLNDDLAKNRTRCTLAYWHHPLWSAGSHGSYAPMTPVWNTLLDAGVDVVLTGHDHNYQRFAPLGRATARDNLMAPPVVAGAGQGMRQFIVGTGGADNYGVEPEGHNHELAGAIDAEYANPAVELVGLLLLRLGNGGYEWKFVQADTPTGTRYSDSGTGTCH